MDWYSGSIPDAVAEVKNRQKVLLVFIAGDDELSKKMAEAFNDSSVSSKLTSHNCVALKLTVDSVAYQQFSHIYPVVVVPSSFFIGKNGLPIEVITGSLEPSQLVEKLDKIMQENQTSDSSQISTNENAGEPMESSDVNSGDVQNGSETTNEPSTSNPDESEENAGKLEDRVERAKTLIEACRKNKALEEQEKERREEQDRRKLGKELQKAQQSRQDNDLKEWAQNRAKEKEDERLARERVRAQIAQDRAERAAKFQQNKVEATAEQKEKEAARLKAEQEKATRDAAMRSTMARLQFRLPNGTSIVQQFSADSALSEARNFVLENVGSTLPNFTLCTTFPRRHFTEANYSETLRDLQLAPSAAILVLPGLMVSATNGEGGFFGSIFWILVSPLMAVWRAISSIFRRSPPPPPPQVANETSEPEPGPSADPAADGPVRRRDPRKFYKEGNIYRINSQPKDDDDDNNTWNGNSTQQM